MASLLPADNCELVGRADREDVPADMELPENREVIIQVHEVYLAVRAYEQVLPVYKGAVHHINVQRFVGSLFSLLNDINFAFSVVCNNVGPFPAW